MYLSAAWRLYHGGRTNAQMLKNALIFDQVEPAGARSSGCEIATRPPLPTNVHSVREKQAGPLTGRIAVFVVDSQTLFRSGLARLLSEDDHIAVVGVSEGSEDLPERCAALSVDVVLTDLQVKEWDGIDLIRMISTTSPGTRVIVLAAKADWRVTPAMTAGAAGFLSKDAEPASIRSAVISAHLGERVLSDEAAQRLMQVDSHYRLTRRERGILHLVGQGATNREIAQSLQLSDKTVRNYMSRLYRKLEIQNRAQISPLRGYPDFIDGPDRNGASSPVTATHGMDEGR
jgi:DNA-binding NarL/FixJ family response regulator